MALVDEHIKTIAQYQNMLRYCDMLQGLRILVIGDIMVDEYIWGAVQRISPEAPVPVVLVKNESMLLGGAANVVNNLCSLDAQVELIGVVGEDALGRRVIQALKDKQVNTEGIFTSDDFTTIRKTRIIAHNQQVVRVDREKVTPISGELEKRCVEHCMDILSLVDAVVISDYGKGLVTPNLARIVIDRCKALGKICAVDPKVPNAKNYRNCSIITPNHHEALQIAGITMVDDSAIERAGRILLEELHVNYVLITCGEQGMAIFEKGQAMEKIDTVAQSVYDVTGAGDTAISALTLAMGAGIPLKEAAILANFAAGVVVGKVGTATATITEIKKAMKLFLA